MSFKGTESLTVVGFEQNELQKQLSTAAQFSKEMEDKLAKAAKEATVAVQENLRLKEKLLDLEKAVVEAKQALQVCP